MALRALRYSNDDILRKKSKAVTEINNRIFQLLDDMADTMYKKEGLGLAAPQVGVLRRVIIVDVDKNLIELINPELVEATGEQENDEGCLSVPGKNGLVKRPAYVKVKGLNRKGEEIEVEGEGLLAIALCHEIDHLDGILYTDRASVIKDLDQEEYDEDEE